MISLKLFVLSAFATLVLVVCASAQLTGVKNIPGDYGTLSLAIANLNIQGVGAGGVTINLLPGNPQTAPSGGYVIGGSGPVLTTASQANPIIINGNGNTITASAAHFVGTDDQGIIKVIGADWVTINGFTLVENPANTVTAPGTNTMTEWGIALLYASPTDGAQNVTIQNCTIDLDRNYVSSFGIYSNSMHNLVLSPIPATSLSGNNAGLKVYSNNITDVNNGIVVIGPPTPAIYNDGIDIGGTTAATGNTITNFGSGSPSAGFAGFAPALSGVTIRNSINYNVSHNTITSSNGVAVSGTMRGVHVPAFSSAPVGTFTNTINQNTLSIVHGSANVVEGIRVESNAGNNTATLQINENDFQQLTTTVAGNFPITGIGNVSVAFDSQINGNTFTNLTGNTTNTFTFIINSATRPANATVQVNNNSIVTQFTKTGTTGTVRFYDGNGISPASVTETNSGNNFSNVTWVGTGNFDGWRSTDGASGAGSTKIIQNNTFSNINIGSLNATIMFISGSSNSSVNSVISGNTISNINTAAPTNGLFLQSGSYTISGNTITNFTSSNIGSTAAINISSQGTGPTLNIERNKIANLTATSGGSVFGIAIGLPATTTNIRNNFIGDLKAPTTGQPEVIRGISIGNSAAGTAIDLAFNTIWINATSSGTNFGTTGVFHQGSASPTSGFLTMRNNNIVNTSTANGTGRTVVFRRVSNNFTNVNALSDNNNLYAGTPSTTNLIFSDGGQNLQTIESYKASIGVAPRDKSSVSENPAFLSTNSADADFLHLNTVTPTALEGGGIAIAGVTNDFDGDTRSAVPDIGADEFAGVSLDTSGPAIVYTTLGNTASTADRVLSVSVTDRSGVPTSGTGRPTLYYRKNLNTFQSAQCIFISGSNYECTINAAAMGGLVVTDTVRYYVVAQDGLGNVNATPFAGTGGYGINPPSSATQPTFTPNYVIVPLLSGTLNVGVGETITSLTNSNGAFDRINRSELNGNITINITSDLTGELGQVALNEYSAGFTVLIKPSGGPRTITGSNTGGLIRFNGADNVRLDGSTAATFGPDSTTPQTIGGDPSVRELSITNTSNGSTATVVFVLSITGNAANNNVIQNLVLSGNDPATSHSAVNIGGANVGSPTLMQSYNNRVENCLFKRASYGVLSSGIAVTDPNVGTIIRRNESSAVTADRLRRGGVLVLAEDNVQVTENNFNGILSNSAEDLIGISLGSQNADVSGVGGGSGVTNSLIARNRVNGVTAAHGSGTSAVGILSSGGLAGANTIVNNIVTGVTSPAANTDIVSGIHIMAGGPGARVLHNSVAMTGDRGLGSLTQTHSFAMSVSGNSSPTPIEIKNNIFYTTQTASASVLARHYAIGIGSGGTLIDSNRNIFLATGPTAGGFRVNGLATGGIEYPSLPVWATITGDDTNSIETDPLYVDPLVDLHLQMGSPALGLGQLIAGINDDHDNDLRDDVPDAGADEVPQSGRSGALAAGTYRNGYFGNATLTGDVTFTGQLNMLGMIDTGANTLNIGCAGDVANAGPLAFILGNLRREICGAGFVIFDVGTPTNGAARSKGGRNSPEGVPGEFSPVTVFVNSVNGPSALQIRAVDTWLPGLGQTSSLSRHWEVTETGDVNVDMTFNYLDEDVYGNESSYQMFRYSGSSTLPQPGSVTTIMNFATATGVTEFSAWGAGVLAPTAASVDVGGRVLTADGRPIRNVEVAINGEGISGPRFVYTGNLGYYNFNDLPMGNYVLTVNSKRYTFHNPVRLVNVNDNLFGEDFIAQPQE